MDLDGTLVATDTLWESLLACARAHPTALLRLPGCLLRGRACFKRALARVALPDVASLPYRAEVLDYLRDARADGRPVVLATAADGLVADAVAAHVGLFSRVLASDGRRNLKGRRKREALEDAFGARGFEYVGDATADRAVWAGAARASCVGLSPSREAEVARLVPIARRFAVPLATLATGLRALRPGPWLRALLVVAPAALTGRLGEPAFAALAGRAALAFGLTGAALAILDDLVDLPVDRRHPQRRGRPFAAGRLPIPAGLVAAFLLAAAGLTLAGLGLPAAVAGVLVGHLGLGALHARAGTLPPALDALGRAGCDTLRVAGGALAVGLVLPAWLLGASAAVFWAFARARHLRSPPGAASR